MFQYHLLKFRILMSREGFHSVAEMRAKQEEIKAQLAKSKKLVTQDSRPVGMTEADAKIAAGIRKRAEAEAERKLKSGNLTSGPGIKVSLSLLIFC